MRRHHWKRYRYGVAAVEAALALPLLFLIALGFVEIGHLANMSHVVHTAARQGARAAVHPDNSNAEVNAAVMDAINNSLDVPSNAVTIRIAKLHTNGTEHYVVQSLDENEQGEAVRVTVTVDYNQTGIPSDMLGLSSRYLRASAVMMRAN